ncbi:similar to cytochrome P450, family 2, subfamily J, polypeptide 4 (predicted), isoform CRA_a [Rattus norvegicus]|uniref:Similar to cytochrome P450, family 2, subfamily J, polypeptide 4 (Predicted), isoform CRA_a n=1 Tax=Rattus norvegicus TaxID=10116 RepID=A6JRI6_RAT|nr:similar to cytochrome P450, family 2, subfamily J, polypeptide 4 (predicted), isoform CRA_a [Rattus norvegicus]
MASPLPQSATASVLSPDSDAGEAKRKERRNDLPFETTGAYTHRRKQNEGDREKMGKLRVEKLNQIPGLPAPQVGSEYTLMCS